MEKTRNTVFFHGDRVILTSNNRTVGYYNGDIGTVHISSVHKYIRLQSGRIIPLDNTTINDVALSYALTIHKAQGSEYDTVIIPISTQFKNMLNRNLLYTAISRAKSKVILVGDLSALEYALTTSLQKRRSTLIEKIH